MLSPPRLVADMRECVGCEQVAERRRDEGKLDEVTAAGRYFYLRPTRDGDYGGAG